MRCPTLRGVLIAALVWAPIASPAAPLADPREAASAEFQRGLETGLARLGLDRAAAQRRLGVALIDITDPDRPRYAAVNGERMYYAASLPKLAILLGAFVRIEAGEMRLDDITRASLTRMIRRSSNLDATRMLDRVGRRRLAEILMSDRFHFYERAGSGGLWVGKPYGKEPAFRRDPIAHLSHAANAYQTARLYYLLETGRLFSPRLAREMKAMLGQPGIRHKFVAGLSGFDGVSIFRKSGTWGQWHSDSALVEAHGHKYIAVALAEDPQGGRWLRDLIGGVHRLVLGRAAARTAETAPAFASAY